MRRTALAAGLALLPAVAAAHSFGRLYNLPVPLWLYLYGAAAALLASFLITAWLATRPALLPGRLPGAAAVLRLPARPWCWLRRLAQTASLGLLLLAIVSGLLGSQDPYANFNMSAFWIGFVLAFAYAVALAGDAVAMLNPWRLLLALVERIRGRFPARCRLPPRLALLPALMLYMAFIWLELFGGLTPRQLSWALLIYTAINLAGAWLFGSRQWLRHGELFSVFLHLLGQCSPLVWRSAGLSWRWPFSGLLRLRLSSLSGLLFVLFMLSSTAFDGLRETLPWFKLFWQDLYQLVWVHWLGEDRVASYEQLLWVHGLWQTGTLLLSPGLYLLVYLGCLWLARRLTGTATGLRSLALRFAPSLIPIALAYHLSHYYTLLLTQGAQLPWLLLDPLGTGSTQAWQWLGAPQAYIPDAAWVWHGQVAMILLGHIVSVVLAHFIALREFAGRRQATLSQLPMLLLMMLYTGSGLWILAQPLNPAGH